jgi:hypothetical protein
VHHSEESMRSGRDKGQEAQKMTRKTRQRARPFTPAHGAVEAGLAAHHTNDGQAHARCAEPDASAVAMLAARADFGHALPVHIDLHARSERRVPSTTSWRVCLCMCVWCECVVG